MYCMYMYMGVLYICTPGKGIGSHGITVTEGYEPPCRCWELNLGPLEKQSTALTAEPSLQPWNLANFKCNLVAY